jgi:D-alanyl-D-alanine carboxypeptidase
MLGFGWIEDLAARRHMHLAPGAAGAPSAARRPARGSGRAWLLPAAGLAGVLALLAALFVDATRAPGEITVARAVPPSGVGLAIRTEHAQILDAPPPLSTPPAAAPSVTSGQLQAVLDAWFAQNNVPGVALGVRRSDGSHWEGAAGLDASTGAALSPAVVYNIASVTKTFTVALVLQLVDQGRVSLDDQLDRYVTGFPHGNEITVRQLIQHTSGLMATDGVAPAEALAAAAATPLLFPPGAGFEYSAPGYYLLALIVEKVLDRSFTDALHSQLLDPLGLNSTRMDEEIAPLPYSTHPTPSPAFRSSSGVSRSSSSLRSASMPAFEYHGKLWSTAGLSSTVSDLTRWAMALWDGQAVVTAETRDKMTTFLGPEFQYAGLGTYPFCPCWMENGRLQGERWGHFGLSGVLEYDPRDRTAIAIYTSSTSLDERLIVAYDDLSKQIRDLLRQRDIAAAP